MTHTALLTGVAGFIGSHLAERLLDLGWSVTGVDNFEPFYDPAVKRENVRVIAADYPGFRFVEADIRHPGGLEAVSGTYDVVVHLAARPGVRPSINNPGETQEVNVRGTQNMLEFARRNAVPQFVFGSSSSVYGVNPNVPWREEDHVLMPISPYASSKVCGELTGHVYSHLHGIRFVALRFFTVFGPRQRPDLAIHKFARMMERGEAIPFFGDGSTRRDYTYVDDIVSGICAAMTYDRSMYEVINLGNNRTVSLSELVSAMGEVFDIRPELHRLPPQPGDVPQTWADIRKARDLLGYEPMTDLRTGLERFREWRGVELKV